MSCTCVYATSKNTPSVRKGYEMGGYVKRMCAECTAAMVDDTEPPNDAAELTRLRAEVEALRADCDNAQALARPVCELLNVPILHDAPKAIEALRADAERYRWLRSSPCDGESAYYIAVEQEAAPPEIVEHWWALGGDMPSGDVDAAIDSAMQEPKG